MPCTTTWTSTGCAPPYGRRARRAWELTLIRVRAVDKVTVNFVRVWAPTHSSTTLNLRLNQRA